jgi:hypothetical protein
MTAEKRQEQTISLLQHIIHIEFDWAGREELFVKLLKLRDKRLALGMFGGSCPPSVPNLGNLEIGPIDWWLEWIMEEADTYWFCEQLGGLFAEHLDNDAKDKFVSEFNKSGSKFRQLLLRFVLPHRSDIITEVFSEDAISFLLADLNKESDGSSFRGRLLGMTATEQFISERLLPLLPGAQQPLLKNLQNTLRQAGSRHGRRFFLNNR